MNSIVYGGTEIKFELNFSSRKTLGLTVYPDQTVVVNAPLGTEYENVEKKVKAKARWILKQLRQFEKYLPQTKRKEFVSGETHLYLGRQYLLKVVKDSRNVDQVKLKGRYLFTQVKNKNRVEATLNEWYRAKASIHFQNIVEDLLPEFENHDLKVKELKIREMKKRWGSCTKDGVITLNLHLIKAPKRCIQYVILHELCHLIYHKHDANFYRLLNSMMPNWKRWKEKLEITLA